MVPGFLVVGGLIAIILGLANVRDLWVGYLIAIAGAGAVIAGIIIGVEDIRQAQKRRRMK